LLFILFLSCRNEYLLDDDIKTQQKTIARQIRFDEIKQIPNLLEKVSEVKTSENSSLNNKIYIDSLNGFSIDTDHALVIENANHNKTYTFKIERTPISSVFENLVLKDLGNGEYDAYIAQYDDSILQNENPSSSDVENHFQLNYIGKKTNVFGRYAICSYTAVIQVYVPAASCAENLHSYGEACIYTGTSGGATQGYSTNQYTTVYYDCEEGGSGGTGNPNGPGGGLDNGEISTSPYPNNSSQNPCNKITSENANAKTLLSKSVVSSKNTTMTATISTDTNEKAFVFGKNSRGNYQASDIFVGANGYNVQMPATHDDFFVEGGAHNHPNSVYEVPSPGDIYWFMHNNSENPGFKYYYTNGASGSTYVFVITNQTAFNSFATNYPQNEYFDFNPEVLNWKTTESIGQDENNVYKYFRHTLGKSQEESMELATAFVIGKYGMGIGISKKDASGNFQPIYVKEITYPNEPGKKTYEKTTECNLR